MSPERLLSARKWLAMMLLCVFTATCPAAAACPPPPLGLTHWWPGDGDGQDIVGGLTGTFQGGVSFAPGLVGQAFHLDGIDGWVNVPHDPSLNFGEGDFTFELWVKFANNNNEQVIIEKYIETEVVATRKGWCLTKMPGDHLRFGGAVQVGNAAIIDVSLPEALVTDTWYHVAVTRQGNLFGLYWNGALLATGEAVVNLNSSASLKFGHRGNPVDTPGSVDTRNFFLNGYVDEVSLYNRALSVGSILSIFQAGAGGKCKNSIRSNPCTYLLLVD